MCVGYIHVCIRFSLSETSLLTGRGTTSSPLSSSSPSRVRRTHCVNGARFCRRVYIRPFCVFRVHERGKGHRCFVSSPISWPFTHACRYVFLSPIWWEWEKVVLTINDVRHDLVRSMRNGQYTYYIYIYVCVYIIQERCIINVYWVGFCCKVRVLRAAKTRKTPFPVLYGSARKNKRVLTCSTAPTISSRGGGETRAF